MNLYTPLLTDLYQLTMAYGYWKLNKHNQLATFHLLFRKNPFKGPYAVCCGLGTVVEFLQQWKFHEDELDYLSSLKNNINEPLFSNDFLDYLRTLKFTCDIDAIAEGVIVFPHEPLLRIQGPLIQCQLLETAFLNIINFQTLIATKASRVYHAACGDPIIEFGMRRAQGPDGAVSASRAAYIGGCDATSNTLAGKLFDIPVRGTHAHSWVTAFDSELEAFAAYAEVLPHNGVLLVDTYNTVQGVKNAITIGKKLREQGSELQAIRLDSGDLADLSIKARHLLDEAGFQNTGIIASNSLDEYVIRDLKMKGAKISAWGVGTNLATAYDQPALDGVYKLSALQDDKHQWQYKLKLSEQEVKVSNPGRHQVRRFLFDEQSVIDVIYDMDLGIAEIPEFQLMEDNMQHVRLDDVDAFVDLLLPVMRKGKLVESLPDIHELRNDAIVYIENFYEHYDNKVYPVALEKNLYELKKKLMTKLRG